MKSKYLDMVFDGWKVCGLINVDQSHKKFFLSNSKRNAGIVLVLRDNDMTKLIRGTKRIAQYLNIRLKQFGIKTH